MYRLRTRRVGTARLQRHRARLFVEVEAMRDLHVHVDTCQACGGVREERACTRDRLCGTPRGGGIAPLRGHSNCLGARTMLGRS